MAGRQILNFCAVIMQARYPPLIARALESGLPVEKRSARWSDILERPEGIEPPTLGSEGRCSIR